MIKVHVTERGIGTSKMNIKYLKNNFLIKELSRSDIILLIDL